MKQQKIKRFCICYHGVKPFIEYVCPSEAKYMTQGYNTQARVGRRTKYFFYTSTFCPCSLVNNGGTRACLTFALAIGVQYII